MSIRKRTTVSKTGEIQVRWVANLTDAKGNQRARTFLTREEAELFHHQMRAAVLDAKVSFAQACDRWIMRRRDDGLSPGTIAQYEACLGRYVMPLIGQLNLTDITYDTLSQLRGQMIEDGKSPTTVRRLLMSVIRVLKAAQEEGYLSLDLEPVRDKTPSAAATSGTKRAPGSGCPFPF